MEMIYHPSEKIQQEAIRAAGELELRAARGALMGFLDEPEEFVDDTIAAIIWSLSQIGGEGVSELLTDMIENAEDDEQQEFVQNAIDNLQITDGFYDFDMFNIDDENLPEQFSEDDFLSEIGSDED